MKAIKYLMILIIITNPRLFAQKINNNYSHKLDQLKTENEGEYICCNSILNNNEDTELIFSEIGFMAGPHGENINQNSHANFTQGFIFEIYAKYNLSKEVQSTIGFTFWQAKTKEVNTPVVLIPSSTIDSKGLKLGLDFTLFKLSNITLSLGPSVFIENITKANSAVFGFGTDLKLKYPVWNNKINILSVVHYKNGSELLNFGGGINYSFISYLAGIEIVIGD